MKTSWPEEEEIIARVANSHYIMESGWAAWDKGTLLFLVCEIKKLFQKSEESEMVNDIRQKALESYWRARKSIKGNCAEVEETTDQTIG